MWGNLFVVIHCFLFLTSCTKPHATVFKDDRLEEEEMAKFCFIGDVGQGTDHQEAIAQALAQEKCHRIVILGDLVYPKGIDSIDDPGLEEKFLRYYNPLFEENPDLIFLLLLGNHDHQGKPGAWRSLYKNDPRYFFPYYYYMVDYGGLCLVALDTSLYFYQEKLPEAAEQTQWLTSLQSRLRDCDVKVALTHHPFKGGGYSGSKDWEGAQGALKVFLDSYIIGVFDIHLAGHIHQLADDGKDERTRMLISGTGGENRGTDRSGYIVLTWQRANPKRIGYRLRFVDTEVNVYSENLPEEEEIDYDENILKTKLEEGMIAKITTWIKSLFSR